MAAARGPAPARLGFLGVGWIGRHRMKAILESGFGEAVAVADVSADCARDARALAPDTEVVESLDALVEMDLDGIVIATPSALHAGQAIAALERGVAVFCQKPLGRSQVEVARVIAAARTADRLLGVDMSYRFAHAVQAVRALARAGELGRVFSARLVFHNAYGPDKAWFRDRVQSGGGCVMDLGVHLIDLAYWILGFPEIRDIRAALYDRGKRLSAGDERVETFASVRIESAGGCLIEIACSWDLHAGRDAVIAADFHGSDGGASFSNIGGSFYDFRAERYSHTQREVLVDPPDDWGGRAASAWTKRLAAGEGFDPEIGELDAVARTIDRIYG